MIKKSAGIILFTLLVALIVFQIYMVNTFKSMPSRIEITLLHGDIAQGLSPHDIESMNENFLISHTKEADIQIDKNKISITMTDENYPNFRNFSMVKGKWFSENQREAVISDELSMNLFGTEDAVGREIDLMNKSYIITGIYKENKLYKKIADSREFVYLPLDHSIDKDLIRVSRILATDKDGNYKQFLEEKFIEQFSLHRVSMEDEEYKVKDMARTGDIISQFFTGYIFLLEFLLLIFMCRMFIWDFNSYRDKYRKAIRKQYVRELLIDNTTHILIAAIKWAVMVFVGIFLLREIIDFQFYVPGKYLPPDYIFDFKFYSDLFLSRQRESALMLSNYEKIYRAVFHTCLGILVAKIMVSLVLYLTISKKIFSKERPTIGPENSKQEVESWQN